ncbi:MAG: hypothetical protein AAFO94_03655, partial [Bacteroidota bacterium]
MNNKLLPLPDWELPNNNLTISGIDPGPHCTGSEFDLELNNSESGIDYQLSDGSSLLGNSQSGNG